MHKTALALAVALLVAPPPVQASTQVGSIPNLARASLEELLEIRILVGSTKGDDIFTTPSTVTVIDAATLRRYNIETIPEALAMVPGVNVGRTYSRDNVTTFRGVLGDSYSNKVLILIDGVPTWHATTGEAAYYRIAIQDVERIEVLRGPASVIFGTNAYSGAINIVLKSSRQRRVQVDTGASDQGGNGGVSLSLGGPGGTSWLVSAQAGRLTGDPFTFVDDTHASGVIRDFQSERTLTLSMQSPRHAVLANVFRTDTSFLGASGRFSSGAGHDLVSNGTILSYRYTRSLSSRVDLSAGTVYDDNRYVDSRSADDLTAGETVGYRASAFAKSTVKVGPHLSVDLGADYEFRKSVREIYFRRDTGEVLFDNNLANRTLHEYSGYAEGTYHPGPRVRLVGGARVTKNELFGANVSSRVAAIYTPHKRQSVKLFWGQSFRAPSLFELYRRSQTGGSFGNESLQPETSDSVEAAYVTSFQGFLLKTTVYHARYLNKITRVPRYPGFVSDPTDTSLTYGNGQEFSANGLEFELTYDVAKIGHAFVNTGYVHGDRGDALPDSDNYNFRYVPAWSGAIGLSRQLGPFSVASIGKWLTSTHGFQGPVPGHTRVDFTLSYERRLKAVRMKHSFLAKDINGRGAQTPEYLRGRVNSLPLGLEPRYGYRLQVSF
jgi:outer membrane receptor protein involved in Fe transport